LARSATLGEAEDVGRLLESLLTAPGVNAAACFEDVAEPELYPCEEQLIANSVASRKAEFATGRACARAALAKAGHGARAIPAAPSGAPIWPAGLVGSITHCDGFRGAAVGPSRALAGLGIDAEPNRPLPEGLIADIASPAERRSLPGPSAARRGIAWDRLLFSAKEAVYKCLPAGSRRWTFADAEVDFDLAAKTFVARLEPVDGTAAPRRLAGRWSVASGVLLTAVCRLHEPGQGPAADF
jgi:4'-phosphopantetheinyl transferase EntD